MASQLKVAVVTTAEELKWVIMSWETNDIEIRGHFDLSEVEDMWGGTTHRSIRGNCSEPPSDSLIESISGSALLDLKPRQCLIVTSVPFVMPDGMKDPMWLDNIYLRASNSDGGVYGSEFTLISAAQLYMTDVTLQGNGESSAQAINAHMFGIGEGKGSVFASESIIANFCGFPNTKWSQGPAVAFRESKSYANITNTHFLNNACAMKSASEASSEDLWGPVQHVSVSSCGGALIECEDVHVALQNVEFTRQDTCGSQCPPDVELAGYLWDPSHAPRLNDRNSADLFGSPIYYADRSMPVACMHCAETANTTYDDYSFFPTAAPGPETWSEGIEGDVAASILQHDGVSVPPTWLAAQPIGAIPGHVRVKMPSAEDPFFLAVQKAWESRVYYQPDVGDSDYWEYYDYDDYGIGWHEPVKMFKTAGLSVGITVIIVLLSLVLLVLYRQKKSPGVGGVHEGDALDSSYPPEQMPIRSGSVELLEQGSSRARGQWSWFTNAWRSSQDAPDDGNALLELSPVLDAEYCTDQNLLGPDPTEAQEMLIGVPAEPPVFLEAQDS